VSEHEDDGEGTIEEEADGLAGEMKILEKRVEDTVGTENGLPGIAANEIADPKRDNDELVEKLLAAAGMKGKIVSERIAEKEREKHDAGGDAHGAEKNFKIDGIFEQFGIVLKIPLVNDDALADSPEAVNEHQCVRKQKEQRDPEERRKRNEEFVGLRIHLSDPFDFAHLPPSEPAEWRRLHRFLHADGSGSGKNKIMFA
jgi:hypothetical protein